MIRPAAQRRPSSKATRPPGGSSIQMRPPWASTTPRAMARPRPAPPVARVRLASARVNGPKASPANEAGKPGPSSMTRTRGEQVADDPAQGGGVALGAHAAGRVEADDHVTVGGHRGQCLDGVVRHLGEIDRRGRHVVAAAVQAHQQEQILDQRGECLDVPLHRRQVARRVGGQTVGQRLHRQLERGDGCAQIVTDAGQHEGALGLEPVPFPFQLVQAPGQGVEGAGGVAQLVGPIDVGPHLPVALLDAPHGGFQALGVAPEGRRRHQHQGRRQDGGHGQHGQHGAQLIGIEHHEPGKGERCHRAQAQCGEGDGQDLVAQRARPPVHLVDHPGGAHGGQRHDAHGEGGSAGVGADALGPRDGADEEPRAHGSNR
jgi:hypothetical protein